MAANATAHLQFVMAGTRLVEKKEGVGKNGGGEGSERFFWEVRGVVVNRTAFIHHRSVGYFHPS